MRGACVALFLLSVLFLAIAVVGNLPGGAIYLKGSDLFFGEFGRLGRKKGQTP